MGFRWPLQKVLDVTETRELAIKAELFRLARDIARLEEDIHRRRDLLRALLTDLASAPPAEQLARRDVLLRCREAEEKTVRRLQEQLEERRRRREERTADLMKLSAKKDTLNKMLQKARREYSRRLDLREQQRANEVFQMTFVRRARLEALRPSA